MKELLKALDDMRSFYDENIRKHGRSVAGLDYNSEEAQIRRFEQVAKVLPKEGRWSLLDYGCGYGSLLRYLRDHGYSLDYRGYDISPAMLAAAREFLGQNPDCQLFEEETQLPPSDFAIACGIFNNKFDTPAEIWLEHILKTLDTISRLSLHGFAFNMLTSYSDSEKMRPDLYYGDPCFFFDFCKRHYSKNVALLHDYGLYDFTILVRKA